MTIFLYSVHNRFVFFLFLFTGVNSLDSPSFGFNFKEVVSAFKLSKSGLIIQADADCSVRLSDRNYLRKNHSPHGELSSSREENFCSNVWHQSLTCTVKILHKNCVVFLGLSFTYHQFTDEDSSIICGQVVTFTMKYFIQRVQLSIIWLLKYHDHNKSQCLYSSNNKAVGILLPSQKSSGSDFPREFQQKKKSEYCIRATLLTQTFERCNQGLLSLKNNIKMVTYLFQLKNNSSACFMLICP